MNRGRGTERARTITMSVFQVWAWGKPRFSVPVLSSSSLCRPTCGWSPCLYRVSPQVWEFLLPQTPESARSGLGGRIHSPTLGAGGSRGSGVRVGGRMAALHRPRGLNCSCRGKGHPETEKQINSWETRPDSGAGTGTAAGASPVTSNVGPAHWWPRRGSVVEDEVGVKMG